jgi:DNA-binding transcriptional LysR family regulator
MDFRDLRYFIAVYEAKGFSRAAAILGTVQSNVSSRIIGLERKWRSLEPTPAGERLDIDAKRVLSALDQTERTFRPLRAA